jgi:ParB-like chromosome segregation protein Spo0J
MNLEIEYKSLSDLIPYARNSRTHSEAQVKQIASSIREFGFVNPILISSGNDIVAGHGRALAAEKLGLDLVPTITLGHLSDTQRRAYVIADNRLAENAGWDFNLLKIEMETLNENDFDLDLIGFGDLEIKNILEEFGQDQPDYSLIDESNEDLEDMQSGVRKAINIEFKLEDYEEAYGLIKYWRSKKEYLGGFILEILNKEKELES